MNNQVIEELEEFIKQQQKDNFIRIEGKIGTIIAKNEETLLDLEHFQDYFVNAESKIEKKNYRFESAISQQDFQQAQSKLKSQDRWELILDIILQEHYQGCLTFRMGFDEFGKLFCYERKKELKAKHLDVLDSGRQYRISLSRFENIDYKQTDLCLEKMRDWLKQNQQISCVRFKQTKIFIQSEEAEKFVFQVQQVEKHKQSFLLEIAQEATNKNNTFKKNLENVFELFRTNIKYYKPFYEAEISLLQPKIAQNITKTAEQFLSLIRQYHDEIKLTYPKPTMIGIKDAQKTPYKNQNQQQYQTRGGYQGRGRGQQIKTRGTNFNHRGDRQFENDQQSQEMNTQNNQQNQSFNSQNQSINSQNKKNQFNSNKTRQQYQKDQQDNNDNDSDNYNSRVDDYE